MTINTHVSDLFFNLDFEDCRETVALDRLPGALRKIVEWRGDRNWPQGSRLTPGEATTIASAAEALDGRSAYSLDRVKQKASWFCEALKGAGGPTVDPDALVADFYARL